MKETIKFVGVLLAFGLFLMLIGYILAAVVYSYVMGDYYASKDYSYTTLKVTDEPSNNLISSSNTIQLSPNVVQPAQNGIFVGVESSDPFIAGCQSGGKTYEYCVELKAKQ